MVGPAITDAYVAAFARDGVVCLRGVFEGRWIEKLARGVERNFADPSPGATHYTPAGAPGAFYDDYCNWRRIAEYCDFVLESPAAAIAARILGGAHVRVFHEHVLVKEPGTREVTPWHHDQTYYCVDGDRLCSVWVPLDPVPLEAAMTFVAGSHRLGRLFCPRLFTDHANYGEGAGYEDVPDIDADPAAHRILSWDMEPGDCLVFHMRTLHGAPGTQALETRRRGFSVRWLGDDAVFATRPWTTSPLFHEVDLTPGAAMDHPSFPIVWPPPRRSRQPNAMIGAPSTSS
jgi:ectoine hydroxylase-related dioxygenase (phytanoyl-CoA dioxygenase family)